MTVYSKEYEYMHLGMMVDTLRKLDLMQCFSEIFIFDPDIFSRLKKTHAGRSLITLIR